MKERDWAAEEAELHAWRKKKYPYINFGREDLELKDKENTYHNLRAKASIVKEKCVMVGIGCPRRICEVESKVTRATVDFCIARLESGIEVMERRYHQHMQPDHNIVHAVDNDSDTELDNLAFQREWKKNITELRRSRVLEEKRKCRSQLERRLSHLVMKKSLDRLKIPLVMRVRRSSPGLPSPRVYWNFYDRVKVDSTYDTSISIRYFGNPRNLSLKSFQSLTLGHALDDDVVRVYIDLLAIRQNAQSTQTPGHEKKGVIRILNFGDIMLTDEERHVVAAQALMDLNGEVDVVNWGSFLIPIQVCGFHWILGRFDVHRMTVVIYDSLCSKVPSAEQLVIEKMLTRLLHEFGSKLCSQSCDVSWERIYACSERQADERSSGIYLHVVVDALLLGYCPSAIRISHRLGDVRECIAEDILVCGLKKKELLLVFPEFLNSA